MILKTFYALFKICLNLSVFWTSFYQSSFILKRKRKKRMSWVLCLTDLIWRFGHYDLCRNQYVCRLSRNYWFVFKMTLVLIEVHLRFVLKRSSLLKSFFFQRAKPSETIVDSNSTKAWWPLPSPYESKSSWSDSNSNLACLKTPSVEALSSRFAVSFVSVCPSSAHTGSTVIDHLQIASSRLTGFENRRSSRPLSP